MGQYISAVPAYGRDYESAKAVKEDWAAGKDFLVQDFNGSGYINKDDAPKGATINIRYKNLTQICPVVVK